MSIILYPVNSEANIYGAILPAVLMFVTQGPFKNKFSLPVARRSKANAIQQLDVTFGKFFQNLNQKKYYQFSKVFYSHPLYRQGYSNL